MAQLHIRVQPKASRNEICDFGADGLLKVRVTAPPTDGKANEAVIKLLAKMLRTAPSSIQIVRGANSRDKTLEVPELSAHEIRFALE